MKRMLSVWAGAAAVSAAHGASWEMEVKPGAIVNWGDYVTVSIFASFDESDYAFAGAEFGIVAGDPFGRFYDLEEQLHGPGASAGIADGPMVTGIVTGQLHSPDDGFFADPGNPILVWTGKFTVVDDFSFRNIELETLTTMFDVYLDSDGTRASALDGFQEGLGDVMVCACPAPGVGLVLGALGFRAARRRR
jgi:hypothetical protein